MELERKYSADMPSITVDDDMVISGYASVFGTPDRGMDTVAKGAYTASLASGRAIRMLWQHDQTQPIGVWFEVREDAKGLYVKGRLLDGVARAKEAAALLRAGAIDGLSIGYRTVRSSKNEGGGRLLTELDLWEVSLVTFPMLPSARVAAKGDVLDDTMRELAAVFDDARLDMAGR